MGFWDDVNPTNWDWKRIGAGVATGGLSEGGGIVPLLSGGQSLLSDPGSDAEKARKALLQQQAQQAGYFAGQSQDAFQGLQNQGQGALAALQAQAQGQNSVSQEQMRQNLGQLLAQQRSLAAGAAPRNAALAARTAAIQSGRIGAGMAGQRALAGLQERNQAQQQYGQLLGTLSGQQLNAALGSRQTAVGGYGAGNEGAPEKSWLEKYGPAIQGGMSAAASTMSDRDMKTGIKPGGPAADRATAMLSVLRDRAAKSRPGMSYSDRALKTDVAPGDAPANKAIAVLQPYTYAYKDPQYGAGPQVGVMAQDLEKAGLKQAVVDTPAGKAIDPGKLSGANTAMIAALGRRVTAIEDAKGGKSTAVAGPPVPPRLVAGPPRRTVQLEEVNPTAQAEQDVYDAARAKRVRDQIALEQSDPAGAQAQYALNARRALLAQMAAGQTAPVGPQLAPYAAMIGAGARPR